MNLPPAKIIDAAHCPLCEGPNDCQLCTAAIYKGPCWCAKVKIPDELITQIPVESRNAACLCRACIMKFHHAQTALLTMATPI
jgi:hypothetical protein